MQVTVEPEALAEWSAHARRSGTQLHARLAALDRDIAPLARTWHGAAADGFADRHRQWRHAASGLFRTLDRLAALMEAARANYLAAETANHRTWQPSSVVVVHAMAAGRGRIRADVEDIRASVRAVLLASDDLVAAWTALAARLTDSVAMAGGDDAGAMFGADHDVMAAAAWQGWRSCLLMIDGIAGGLAVTGNNLADAERKSTAGPTVPFLPIAARGASVPGPGPPPAAGGAPAEQLEAFWPTADPDRLRNAADAWRASAAAVHRSADAVFAAVDRLTSANTDATLAEMRRFTRAALSTDPTSGLVGVLAGTGGRIASACSGLADLTERTRGRIRDTVVHYASGDEWYHPVADVLDVFVRFKPGRFLATAEDAYLLQLALSSIHDEHVRAVASLRGDRNGSRFRIRSIPSRVASCVRLRIGSPSTSPLQYPPPRSCAETPQPPICRNAAHSPPGGFPPVACPIRLPPSRESSGTATDGPRGFGSVAIPGSASPAPIAGRCSWVRSSSVCPPLRRCSGAPGQR